jgi:hypothetical protein
LGEKHWGESKIVPEDPAKGAGAGVEGSGNSGEFTSLLLHCSRLSVGEVED